MRFEYKIQRQIEDDLEVFRHSIYKEPLHRIKRICTIIPVLLTMCVFVYEGFSRSYEKFFFYLEMLGVEIALIVALALLIKRKKRKNKKIIKDNHIDGDSVNTITIENDIFIKENEFSSWQLPVRSIKCIDLLKHELAIYFNSSITINIPYDALPVSIDEFIEIFKSKNSSLKVNDCVKKKRRLASLYYGTIILTLVLSITASFFIAKNRYGDRIKFNYLIMQDELKSENNGNSYLYKNENLNISIYFPDKWNGNYGINEIDDQIEVYYLAEGNIESTANLIFRIEKGMNNCDDIDSNFIRFVSVDNVVYSMYGPRRGSKFYGSDDAYEEYKKMLYHAKNLTIK